MDLLVSHSMALFMLELVYFGYVFNRFSLPYDIFPYPYHMAFLRSLLNVQCTQWVSPSPVGPLTPMLSSQSLRSNSFISLMKIHPAHIQIILQPRTTGNHHLPLGFNFVQFYPLQYFLYKFWLQQHQNLISAFSIHKTTLKYNITAHQV